MVGFGRSVPKGSLPVYKVASEKEAQDLIVLACGTDAAGTHYARELAEEQTLDNLEAFSKRLELAHGFMRRSA